MKKLCLLLSLLTLLLCSCLPTDLLPFLPQTTPEETTPDDTTPDVTTPDMPAHQHVFGEWVITKDPTCGAVGEMTATCSCGATQTTEVRAPMAHSYGEAVIMRDPTCVETGISAITCSVCGDVQQTVIPATGKHTYGEAVVTKQPTCVAAGEKTATCSGCGDEQKTPVSATGEHVYENGMCSGCNDKPIPLYASPSVYDADGDGKTDIYNFSTKLLDVFKNGIHVWAGDYDKTLSSAEVGSAIAGSPEIRHWYVTENQNPAEYLVYRVTVPATGQYEMVIHFRMKDDQERGTKYTINPGSGNEQVFETSYGYTGMNYGQMRDSQTLTTYMYGIKVNLVAGENIIKIEQSSKSPKCQHYRDFYFVKTGEFHAHVYENETVTKQATCSESGIKTATCSCGKAKTVTIPATYQHTYVNDICTGCGRQYIAAGITHYAFLHDNPGFAGGTISFLPEASGVYTFYWGDANGKLANHSLLYSGTFTAEVEADITVQSFTAIPKGATRVLAVNKGETVTYSYTIPESRRMTAEELYNFGAISDTHQGVRYGATSIPYNHFVNAAKVLYEKGAIAIGICGDFSYNNEESEYILHEKAIKEIYEFAPDMPIFTTTGNHEAKYTGFSYDWYMQYARDVVDYNSDLDYKYFDGNELDYVVELPDGSVMIYFHQQYYDYGNSTSRLVTDEQLVWLEARLEQYKDQTVFFFFHTFMDEMVGDASTPGNEYGLPMISSTVEYKKFTEYFTKYTNVVYFSGHSHWAFDAQLTEPKPGKTNDDKNIDDLDGTFATMVHIPACSTPRVLVGSGNGRSEGYIVRVYENCVVFEGYEFVQGETFAYATYIIEK